MADVTPLSKALHGDDAPARPTPLAAFEAARRAFLAGERVDMGAIAQELGVSRVTLYRWVGNRGQLLGEVLAELAIETARRERRRGHDTGGRALARVAAHLVRSIMSNDAMQQLLRAEPDFALKVLTTSHGPTAARVTAYWVAEIEAETAAGHLRPPLAPADLAYLVVRLSESFVYKEVIAGEPADPADVARVFELLLCPDAGPEGPRPTPP